MKELKENIDNDTLQPAEPHPAAFNAFEYIRKIKPSELLSTKEALASNAIEGNRLAQVCLGTLKRIENLEPVSDRYLLGLAWTLKFSLK